MKFATATESDVGFLVLDVNVKSFAITILCLCSFNTTFYKRVVRKACMYAHLFNLIVYFLRVDFSGVKPGTLMVDSSTIDPAVSQEMALAAKEKSAVYMDAPVSGGKWLNNSSCGIPNNLLNCR